MKNRAFTLIELFVVIAIIAVLIALLIPGLRYAKGQAQSVSCKNHLHQIGIAMQMYVSEHNTYPSALGGGSHFQTWADQLATYNPLNWTNLSWHCPTYIAEGGIVMRQPPSPSGGNFKFSSSYAYNAFGMSGYGVTSSNILRKGEWLGLGDLNLTVSDNRIVAPSEMYVASDTRPFQNQNGSEFIGRVEMQPWQLTPSQLHAKIAEAKPPHAEGYNMLYADTHVSLVKRKDYLYPPRSAQNWNRDNQPHPELWSPPSEWAVPN